MYVINLIKNFLFKIVNFIFGKTKLFIFILGWFLLIAGVFMLVWPERARNKLVGIGFGQVKWLLIIAIVYLASLLLSLGGKIGLLLTLAGAIGMIYLYYHLKKKTYNKIKEWFSRIPLKLLKFFAFIQITIGAVMLILQRRIW